MSEQSQSEEKEKKDLLRQVFELQLALSDCDDGKFGIHKTARVNLLVARKAGETKIIAYGMLNGKVHSEDYDDVDALAAALHKSLKVALALGQC